jgi:hypothetical protein
VGRVRGDNRCSLFTLAVAFGVAIAVPAAPGQEGNLATPASGALRKGILNVQVTLDVFSGRPNPSWQLSAGDEQELTRRLQGLPPREAVSSEGDLGYRGFRIAAPAPGAASPREIVVSKGTVTIRDNAGIRHYVDANGVEAWLLDQARRHGYGALVAGH